MLKIRECGDGTQYAHSESTSTIYALDGTPMAAPADVLEWPIVGEYVCVLDWQDASKGEEPIE